MRIEADVVIVGTGVGGLFGALSFPREKKIVMITKSDLESSDSFLARGGSACRRWSSTTVILKTRCARDIRNRKESVDIMIRSSQEIIRQLVGYGVDFEKKDGEFAFTREGAHSRPRICFHEDVTGKEITSKLLEQVKALKNVTLYEYTTMTDLLIDDGICKGIKAVRRNEDGSGETEELEIYGENTILASGGIGGLYQHSTNFPHLTGDA